MGVINGGGRAMLGRRRKEAVSIDQATGDLFSISVATKLGKYEVRIRFKRLGSRPLPIERRNPWLLETGHTDHPSIKVSFP